MSGAGPIFYPFKFPNNRLQVSHSSLGMTFRSCQRKFEFAKIFMGENLEKDLPAEAGKALHTGYQNFLIHKNIDAAVAAMMLEYPVDLCSNPANPRSLEACYATLEAMCTYAPLVEYEIATIKCLDGVERPAVEVPFEIRIKNFFLDEAETIDVSYVGFIDAVLYSRLQHVYHNLDIKTHRINVDDLTAKYRFDEQCLPYQLVLEQALGNKLQSLSVKYLACYIDIKEPKIRLYPFIKTSSEIDDWARGLLVRLQQLKMCYNLGWFERNSNSCFAFNKECHWSQLCSTRDPVSVARLMWFAQKPRKQRKPVDPWIIVDLDLGL
jgi:hypothetical protein